MDGRPSTVAPWRVRGLWVTWRRWKTQCLCGHWSIYFSVVRFRSRLSRSSSRCCTERSSRGSSILVTLRVPNLSASRFLRVRKLASHSVVVIVIPETPSGRGRATNANKKSTNLNPTQSRTIFL